MVAHEKQKLSFRNLYLTGTKLISLIISTNWYKRFYIILCPHQFCMFDLAIIFLGKTNLCHPEVTSKAPWQPPSEKEAQNTVPLKLSFCQTSLKESNSTSPYHLQVSFGFSVKSQNSQCVCWYIQSQNISEWWSFGLVLEPRSWD